MRVLVTASRSWTSREPIYRVLDALYSVAYCKSQALTVVHGTARGGDTIADDWARWRMSLGWNVEVERHPAQWKRYGKAARRLRNITMVVKGADICVAFIRDKSPGATHCSTLARRLGIRTKVIPWPGYAYIVDSLIHIMVTEMG